jgi:hypothetical protein
MKRILLIALLIAGAAFVPTPSQAQRLSIEIGDRPYYTRGPAYWHRGRQYVWVPGHWARHGRVWIHGHYVIREGGPRRGWGRRW